MIIKYIKENGIRRIFQVIYRYKIHNILCKILNIYLNHCSLLDVIVIESHTDFDFNGGAFYEYLLENNLNEKYKIVWLLKNDIPRLLPHNVIGVPLYKPSMKKAYYICRAKYFLADNEITEKVRKDQKSFYLTHGAVTLKSVKGLASLPSSVDYILSPSKNYDKTIAEQLDWPYPNTNMLHIGIPSNDILYKSNNKSDIKKIIGQEYKKVILWMPTFRKGGGFQRNDSNVDLPLGVPLIETIAQLEQLQVYLEKNEILMIIKIHPMQDLETIFNLKEQKNIKVLTNEICKSKKIDNFELYKYADALISDYSSAAYIFLLLNRPIAFILSDFKDYKLDYSVDNVDDYLVGPQIYTFEEFITFINDVIVGNDVFKKKRETLIDFLYDWQDGENCKRLAEFMGII
ncbi:CDP-glycerol glycerophosphotransferase family protein [Amedibacillus sp. YH-ame10]